MDLKAYGLKWRRENPERVKFLQKRFRATPKGKAAMRRSNEKLRRQRKILKARAKSGPCFDCGGIFPPEVYDFDHVKGKKKFEVSRGFSRVSAKALEDEIKKCDLVCANCHRVRTSRRRQGKPLGTQSPEYFI